MPLPVVRCAFLSSSGGTSTVILRAVSMTPQYTIPDTSIDYGPTGQPYATGYLGRGGALYARNTAGETSKNSASLRMWALLSSRLPFRTREAMERAPKMGV